MKLYLYFSPALKINSKWVKDLNVRPENRKLLEKKNIGKIFQDLEWARFFFWIRPKSIGKQSKYRQMNIKLKSYCTTKETIILVQRQHTKLVKILVNYKTDKG
jgi:hypothetical protein